MANNFLQKSWLFEVVDSKTRMIRSSFTLVIPPQSVRIREPQRTGITKTFGGAIVDDYGPDNLEITIQGISGTAHAFPTFRTVGQSTGQVNQSVQQQLGRAAGSVYGYDQKGAFYVFRNDILRYKDRFDNFEDMELWVYDLGEEQVYKCALLEFTLDRQSQQPLKYPYNISLFVLERPDTKQKIQPRPVDVSRDPFDALQKIQNSLSVLETPFRVAQSVLNRVATAQAVTTAVLNRFQTSVNRLSQFTESPLTLAKRLTGSIEEISRSLEESLDQGKMTVQKYSESKEVVNELVREATGIFGFVISEGSQRSKRETVEYNSGTQSSDSEFEEIGLETTSEVEAYSYSGLRLYSVKATDTLQSIALDQLGDSALWYYIAAVNGIQGNDDISSGDQIYIPLQVNLAGISKDSFILSENPTRNPYGTDILLDGGEIVVHEGNDVATIDGIENVKQAINNRFTTPTGSLIKQTAYGLSATPGVAGTDISRSYIRMAARSTVLADPRVSSVTNVQATANGSVIRLSMNIQVVGYEESLPVTVDI